MSDKQATGGTAKPLPNNFSAKKPADDSAPKVGNGQGYPIVPNSNNRGKDGTGA